MKNVVKKDLFVSVLWPKIFFGYGSHNYETMKNFSIC